MNSVLRTTIFLLCIITLTGFETHAQNSPKKKKDKFEWGNLGMGYSSQKFYSDFTSYSYGLDYNRTIGKVFMQGGIQGQLPSSELTATLTNIHVAVGYGLGLKSRWMAALSLGPGYMVGVTPVDTTGGPHQYYYHKIGLATVLQLIAKPAPDFGIGLELFGNFNTSVQNVGVRLVIHISNNPNKEIKREHEE